MSCLLHCLVEQSVRDFCLFQRQFLRFNKKVVNNWNLRTMTTKMDATQEYIIRARRCIPLLNNNLHKGQAGRIGVVGGSFEYTGAPFFSAISALKFGADLVHVFCSKDAAIPIKSYSPEVMVHPVLDDSNDPIKLIEPWLERLHVIVIGPGLGRDPKILATVRQLIDLCRGLNKPLVLDADATFLISQDIKIIQNYPAAIITPNVIEFGRIFGNDDSPIRSKLNEIGSNVTILRKGSNDIIYSGDDKADTTIEINGGSGRRCGGQGDILSGCTAAFYWWTLRANEPEPSKIASCASSHFLKRLNEETFKLKGRSMTSSDMINNIGIVFAKLFER